MGGTNGKPANTPSTETDATVNGQGSSPKSLYDRLGGIYPIAAVVNDFSDRVVLNSIAGRASKNPQLREWSRNEKNRLPGLKFMRTLWVAAVSGGPFTFVPTKPGKCPLSLENAHERLKISPDEFAAVAGELSKSLDRYGVPELEKQEVLNAFAAHAGEVSTGYFKANDVPEPEVKC